MKQEYRKISRPEEGEYAPYAMAYISLVPDDDVLQHLQQNAAAVKEMIKALPEEMLNKGYAPSKWTLKEVLVHIIDTERVFAYRAMCISRNDKTLFPGYEQDDYVRFSNANERSIENIMAEYESVRASSIAMLNSLSDDMLLRTGTANNAQVSVRGIAYQIAGHELHHLNIIKERYLGNANG